jgi:hypothetical protein
MVSSKYNLNSVIVVPVALSFRSSENKLNENCLLLC